MVVWAFDPHRYAGGTCDRSIFHARCKPEGLAEVISEQTNIQGSRRSWSESRVGRILSFVAITWALAGAFILLQEGLPTLLDVMVRKGWIPDTLVMPNSPRA